MNGIVLAGGENRRMGADKAFLKIAGRPMIEHVFRAIGSVVSRIIVVTNTPDVYAQYNVEVTTDAINRRGSLIGIYSGLLKSRDEHNFVVACDMPFMNRDLLSFMACLAGSADVIVPKVEGFVEPLHAVYRRSLLPVIEDHIERDQRRIKGIFEDLRVRYVTEEEIDRFDPGRRSFINLNRPDEYEEAAVGARWS
jgi:molybdopterin-guanine dinucleotide biosynthesis protein A